MVPGDLNRTVSRTGANLVVNGYMCLVYLWQLQGSHHSSKAKHVAQGALQLRCQLDGLVEQGRPLLCASCAAQQVHCHHDRHGVEPEKRREILFNNTGSMKVH